MAINKYNHLFKRICKLPLILVLSNWSYRKDFFRSLSVLDQMYGYIILKDVWEGCDRMSGILIHPIIVYNFFVSCFVIQTLLQKLFWHGVFSFWQLCVSYLETCFGQGLTCDSFCLMGSHIIHWNSLAT